jgi:hypothetical protein
MSLSESPQLLSFPNGTSALLVRKSLFGAQSAACLPEIYTAPTSSVGSLLGPTSGDFDGDGLLDMVAANDMYSPSPWLNSGAAFFFLATSGPYPTLMGLAQADGEWVGWADGQAFGRSVGVGDLNGDGASDLVVLGADTARLVYGGPTIPLGSNMLDQIGIEIATLDPGVEGGAVAVGDFDGDGYDDIVARDLSSAAWGLWSGGPTGSTGAEPNTWPVSIGTGFWEVLDFNCDGIDDLAFGSNAIYVKLGNSAGWAAYQFADVEVLGTYNNGAPMASGDVDQDGCDDLLVRVSGVDYWDTSRGKWKLLLGSDSPPATIDPAVDSILELSGSTAASALEECWIGPDIDGGGFPDLVCVRSSPDTPLIHLIEDPDLDGDLWSVMDCDADDNDPTVH